MAYDDYMDRLERRRREPLSAYDLAMAQAEHEAEMPSYEGEPVDAEELCSCGRVKESDRTKCPGCYGMDSHEGNTWGVEP